MTKTCNRCKVAKPATPEFFVRHKARPDGLFSLCKSCRNPAVNAGSQRRRQAQIEHAGKVPGRCDICLTAMTAGRGSQGACWDHDHATGEFRGWLCGLCNRALGCARDRIDILENMITYLRKSK